MTGFTYPGQSFPGGIPVIDTGGVITVNGSSAATGQAGGIAVPLNTQLGASQAAGQAVAAVVALVTQSGTSQAAGQAAGVVLALSRQSGSAQGPGQVTGAVIALSTAIGASAAVGQTAATGTALNTQAGASAAVGQASAVDATNAGTTITVNGSSAATGQAAAFANFLALVAGASQALGQASGDGAAVVDEKTSTTVGGRRRRRPVEQPRQAQDDDLVRRVREKWDAIERANENDKRSVDPGSGVSETSKSIASEVGTLATDSNVSQAVPWDMSGLDMPGVLAPKPVVGSSIPDVSSARMVQAVAERMALVEQQEQLEIEALLAVMLAEID